MKFLSSLDAQDRRLLLCCVGIALAVATGFLLPDGNGNDNPLPSTCPAGRHGARAAYQTLLRSGYSLLRWKRPLSDLAPEIAAKRTRAKVKRLRYATAPDSGRRGYNAFIARLRTRPNRPAGNGGGLYPAGLIAARPSGTCSSSGHLAFFPARISKITQKAGRGEYEYREVAPMNIRLLIQ